MVTIARPVEINAREQDMGKPKGDGSSGSPVGRYARGTVPFWLALMASKPLLQPIMAA